jgi:hypothetical protein
LQPVAPRQFLQVMVRIAEQNVERELLGVVAEFLAVGVLELIDGTVERGQESRQPLRYIECVFLKPLQSVVIRLAFRQWVQIR